MEFCEGRFSPGALANARRMFEARDYPTSGDGFGTYAAWVDAVDRFDRRGHLRLAWAGEA